MLLLHFAASCLFSLTFSPQLASSESYAEAHFFLFSADEMGIFDLYMVKRQMFVSAAVISSQLLLVDEIMKAGHGQK